MSRRILTLTIINDNKGAPGLLNRWGWSVYAEYGELRILFDADTDPRVMEYNAEALGVDYSSLDFAVLSHHHRDHYGGFPAVAERRRGLLVYVPPGPMEWMENIDLKPRIVEKPLYIPPGIWLSGPLEGGGILEQSMGFEVGGRLVVLVGCSHPGPCNMAKALARASGLSIAAVIGGYHRPGIEQLDCLAETAEYLSPAHCSGEDAEKYAKRLHERYLEVRTGSRLKFYPDGMVELEE